MKKYYTSLTCALIVIFGMLNTTRLIAQCTNTSSFGSATAPTGSSAVTISTCSFQSEYSTINSVVAGNRYVITASIAGTYITMHFSTPSGAVVAAGVTPLQFTAPCAGTYYAHWNTNSSCGAASSCMTTTIACSSCGAAASQCTMTSSFGSATAPTSGTTTISTCSFQSEYSTITSVVAARVYRMTASIANTFITIRQGTSSGPVVASGRTPLIWTSTVAGTYYSHWNTNNSCGTASSCMTTTIGFVGSSPCSGSSGCTFSSSFGSATIPANNNVVTISTCSFAGEYSTISGAVSGQTLRFTSSVATDFITIHSGTSNGPVIASGVTPLQFANTFTGTLYAHWALNSSCGSQSSCRTTTVQCVSCSAPAPANDLICNATNITCGQTLAGTTVSSTTTSETTLPFCTTTGGTAGGVWYRLTGFTAGQNITASLCGSGYDTKVHVYSSSTGTCSGTLSCVAGNDDFCGLQSQVSFVATAVPGLTYFIYVHGFSSNTGTFSLNVTCANPTQPNDICTGAIPVACGGSVSGNTSLGTPDANACGGPSSPGLWHTITPAVASNITLSLCTGTTYDSRLSVYTGPCASLVLVSGGCNDDFCGLQSQVTFTGSAGVTYYILVNGFTTGSGPYTLTATCTPITPPPANDNCAGATPVSCGGSVSGNTTFATDDAGFPACPGTGNNFKGVWHTITLPTSGTVTLSLCGGSLWDSYLRLFSGTCGALTCIASDDDGCGGVGLSTLTTAPLAAGTYRILVAGFSSTAFGPYTLSATCNLCAAPPNGGTVTGPVSGCTGSQLVYSTTGASGSLQWQVSTTSASGPFTNVSGATTSSLTYVPVTSGNYYFQVSASGAGCTAGTSNVFTTSVLSSGGMLTTSATPSSSACPGTTINLNGNFSTGTGSLTITISSGAYLDEVEWTVTGGFSGGPYGFGTTNIVTITPSSYPVTFSINSQGSFNDNTPTYTVFCNSTSTVLVTGTLSGGSSFTSGPLNCAGSSGTLTNPSWTGPGGFTANTLVASLPVTPTSGGAYTLSGLSPTGCPVSSTVTVNVSPAPQALASSNAPVCNGSSLTFFGNNNASGQSTGNSWLWSGPSFSSASQNPSISSATTSNSGTYTLTVTNSFGCTQSSTHTVVVNPNPVLSVASSTNATCAGLMDGCIDFDAGNGTPLYLYDLNGNSTLDGIYCGLAAGSYTASVIDDNGCEATSLTVTITDLDLIPPVITIPAIDRVVQCNGAGNTSDFNDWLITKQGDADASDNCTPVAQLDNSWVNTYNVGNWVTDCGTTKHINVGFAVYDQSGNYSDTTYSTFYIVDTLPPVITFTPLSVSVNTDAGLCTSNAAIGTAIASDDCAGAGMILTNDAPALFSVGNTLVTWTATDQCGNSSSSTQTVTVTDNENPVPNCSAAQTQTNDAGDCGANIIVLAPAPSDNCGILSAVNNYNSTADASGHYDVGTTTVTWTVID
ncbi:MAG TPA: HYR domain-containing protein, partial [Bacteroidia bacterium]|nr:HYR domain-containing protein [Bacteroidia bacterium]